MDKFPEDSSQNIAECHNLLHREELEHHKFRPPSFLQEYVEHIWTLKIGIGSKIRRDILVPNGQPGFIICLGNPGIRVDSFNGRAYPISCSYYTVTTRPFAINQQGGAWYVGVELKPYGLAAFMTARQKANSVGLLSELFGELAVEELQSALRSQDFLSLAIKHVVTFLAERTHPLPPRDLTRIASSTALIQKQEGVIKTTELAHRINISPSTLYRLFNRYIGISPEQFIGIVRYNHFVKSLTHPGSESHILAALHGYYDEAHAAKDFKKYTGLSKKDFLNTYASLTRIMHADD